MIKVANRLQGVYGVNILCSKVIHASQTAGCLTILNEVDNPITAKCVLMLLSNILKDNSTGMTVSHIKTSLRRFPVTGAVVEFTDGVYQLPCRTKKYHTGFNHPLLPTKHVVKKLSGIKAVQTRSRVNRRYHRKTEMIYWTSHTPKYLFHSSADSCRKNREVQYNGYVA